MPSVERVIQALNARPAGRNRWRSKCPGHGGNNPTALTITLDGDRIRAHCFAHDCSIQAIAQGAGLEVRDFLPEGDRPARPIATDYDYYFVKIYQADIRAGKKPIESDRQQYQKSITKLHESGTGT